MISLHNLGLVWIQKSSVGQAAEVKWWKRNRGVCVCVGGYVLRESHFILNHVREIKHELPSVLEFWTEMLSGTTMLLINQQVFWSSSGLWSIRTIVCTRCSSFYLHSFGLFFISWQFYHFRTVPPWKQCPLRANSRQIKCSLVVVWNLPMQMLIYVSKSVIA